jgi:hypothetical protein
MQTENYRNKGYICFKDLCAYHTYFRDPKLSVSPESQVRASTGHVPKCTTMSFWTHINQQADNSQKVSNT